MASKFALVIANMEYQDASFAKLTAPGKDAEEFAYVLREPELAAFDDVQVLINEEERKARRVIAHFFADRKRDDLLLLYFSGHGIRNEQGQLYLAANDTEVKILEATGIPAEFITSAMNNSRSQRQLLILDCCNSGAFAYGSKSASGVGKSMGIATAFEGSGFGRVVLTATDATQYAWEGDKVIGDTEKSVFTHFLIEGLKGKADLNRDGRIDVDELYDYTYEQVVRRTPKQTPGKWSYKQQGDIILRTNLEILAKSRDEVEPQNVPKQKKISPEFNARFMKGVLIFLLVGSLTIWGISTIVHNPLANYPKSTLTAVSVNLLPVSPNTSLTQVATDAPLLTETPIPPTSLLDSSPTITSDKDRMTLMKIPAGPFTMGSENGESDEKPKHIVTLDTFWIDKIEVTNAMYAECAQDGACDSPASTKSQTRDSYYSNSKFNDYPVIYVTWNDAKAYCSWAGRRLPTEAEWEKAARGNNALIYPWGNHFDGTRLNFCDKNCSFDWADKYSDDGYTDTAPSVSYANGASPYGVLNMAGNVWEWVSSLYRPYPYDAVDGREDLTSKDSRVRRGGSWYHNADNARSSNRNGNRPGSAINSIGFRCALSATP